MESASRLLTRRTLERLKAIATGEYTAPEPPEEGKATQTEKADRDSKEAGEKPASKSTRKSGKSGSSAKTGGERKPATKKSSTKKK